MSTQTPKKRGYVFTFGVPNAPPEQMTIVSENQASAQAAADRHCKAQGWLSAQLWEIVAPPKVMIVSGDRMLPVTSWETADDTMTVRA